ncbi:MULTISPECIES: UPF0182 family membrane protein [unclassified Nitrospina]|uniref:UPF0182 family membrane protein n=1 Tax=unclassified Nitrospina TaxID=2638683 RepID=UPI003F975BDB
MRLSRKWFVALVAVVLFFLLFTEKLVSFYIDLVWFEKYGLLSVIWTILGSQFGFGFLFGGLFLAVTFGILRRVYQKTSHLPVILADQTRRDMPFLEMVADNLKPLVLLLPLVFSVFIGLIAAERWDVTLKFLNHVKFGEADPIFHKDYSFYLFTLPFLEMVKGWLWAGLALIGFGVSLIYFFKQYIFLSPKGFATLPEARRTLSLLAAFAFLNLAFDMYLRRYGLLIQSNSQVVAGISYVDDWGRLPAYNLLIVLSFVGTALSIFNINRENLRRIFIWAGAVVVIYAVGNVYPGLLTRFVVAPNELEKETPYIEHTIAGTNRGFDLKGVEENVLTGANTLDAEAVRKNDLTIENIRLWDQAPLLDTLGQIQEIRTYYQFKSVDNDRYILDGKYQQTLLSPRELDSTSLPNRTWINEHLTFTHGYGLSLSPVNQMTPEGLPVLHIKDIPPQSSINLQVTQPEIYYGEMTNDYVFVNTGTEEFDYPKGEKNVYKNYEGKGGIAVNSFLRKVMLATRFKTTKILFSNDISNESHVLMYRNITERVQTVAPFLKLDRDPYLVITDAGRLKWIYDAYTTSDKFPYSQSIRDPEVIRGVANYIRNSVKIVIDAYDGDMTFYITEPDDPIIATYAKLFPAMFEPLEKMPDDLRKHIRYPADLFAIQAFVYGTYHMETPQVFYNKEDQWQIPVIDGTLMQPYYTIMKLPKKDKEEYILMLPFTPRNKENLSAWMVARSDGAHYGKMAAYTFPKQKLVYGPSQVVARINQDAVISRQISLWDQRGSNVIQGNLLVIPVDESLIYVRPLYLKAEGGKIPELKRVIVSYLDQVAMEPTLQQALAKIFPGLSTQDLPDTIIDESGEKKGVMARAKVEAKTETEQTLAAPTGSIVLKKSDYLKIKEHYQRALRSQNLLDNAFSGYKEDLKDLGTLLENAEVMEPSVEKKKKEATAPPTETPSP